MEKYDIVFVGDSITHFFHSSEGAGNIENEKVWQKFFGCYKVLNLGYGFDRPQNTLWHLDNGEFAPQKPKIIILNIGTNCFSISERYDGDTPEVAFEGIKAVIERLFELSPESKLILMEIFPRRPMSISLTANTATNTAILKTLFIWSILTNGGVAVVLNVMHSNAWIAMTG